MDLQGKIERIAALNRTFTPSAPVSRREAFSGRIDQIFRTTGAISQPGRHVVLYGERGVGKTSLANILSELLVPSGSEYRDYAVRLNCTVSDTYTTLWTRVFRELDLEVPESWAYGKANPDDVRRLLADVEPPMVIVLDEYDRLEDDDALSFMADTIKSLSDHQVRTKLVLVGVSDSIEMLIGEHESVVRAIEEVQMPRMKSGEIREVVNRGFGDVDMTIASDALGRLVKLAEGLPTYAHSISLKAGTNAVQDDRSHVDVQDIVKSTEEIVKEKHSSTAAYFQAIQSPRPENLYAQVLAACALATKDALGYFSPAAVRGPLSKILGKHYDIPAFSRHLSEFLKESRGQILQRRGESHKYRYRFRDPLMQPFAIMAALSGGLIPESFTDELFSEETEEWNQLDIGV